MAINSRPKTTHHAGHSNHWERPNSLHRRARRQIDTGGSPNNRRRSHHSGPRSGATSWPHDDAARTSEPIARHSAWLTAGRPGVVTIRVPAQRADSRRRRWPWRSSELRHAAPGAFRPAQSRAPRQRMHSTWCAIHRWSRLQPSAAGSPSPWRPPRPRVSLARTRGRSTLSVPATPAGFCEGPSKASAQAPPAAKVSRVGHQRRLGATYRYGETRADPSKGREPAAHERHPILPAAPPTFIETPVRKTKRSDLLHSSASDRTHFSTKSVQRWT